MRSKFFIFLVCFILTWTGASLYGCSSTETAVSSDDDKGDNQDGEEEVTPSSGEGEECQADQCEADPETDSDVVEDEEEKEEEKEEEEEKEKEKEKEENNENDDGKKSNDANNDADGDADGIGDACDFEWTFYWVLYESDYDDGDDGNDGDLYICDEMTNCPTVTETVGAEQGFIDDVNIEGTGYLTDERMINLHGDCPDPNYPNEKCFFFVDTNIFPYGVGSDDNPLHPWRTVASDSNLNLFGAKFYVQELDGAALPSIDPSVFDPASAGFEWDDNCGVAGCYRHDGCVIVEDSGVSGNHLDFFALTESAYESIDLNMNEVTSVHAYQNSPKCP